MGRSRGGNTTKIHALVDRDGLPIELKLTAGQAHDGKSAENMLDHVGKGTVLLADRGYDSDAIREKLEQQGARANNIRPLAHEPYCLDLELTTETPTLHTPPPASLSHLNWVSVKPAAAQLADLDGVRIHDLRHTFASFAVASGGSLPVLGRQLGHSQPQTTQRYAHLADDPVRQLTQATGQALLTALNGNKS